jgi:hypothetical protein
MYFLDEGFTFRNFLIDVLTISIFVFWFWLVITVAVDLFRRSDISGWGKAGWVIGWIVFPFIAGNQQRAEQARDELRRVVGFSAADEIEKLDRLKKAGSISDAEFTRLRARLVQ